MAIKARATSDDWLTEIAGYGRGERGLQDRVWRGKGWGMSAIVWRDPLQRQVHSFVSASFNGRKDQARNMLPLMNDEAQSSFIGCCGGRLGEERRVALFAPPPSRQVFVPFPLAAPFLGSDRGKLIPSCAPGSPCQWHDQVVKARPGSSWRAGFF